MSTVFATPDSYSLQARPGTWDIIAAEYDTPGNLVKISLLRNLVITSDFSQNYYQGTFSGTSTDTISFHYFNIA